ncbi:MFS family permease [Fontibacillus solani]|uniref:MFS family permease n=1 Tax=Fontibacillus solani TaxID=1572857 RepID=A0A7W3XSY3_9BACL|nr:MFS transporter [Fontibacillus solani]MBA9087197.1 MFS family permease [Fontibacillus solani]
MNEDTKTRNRVIGISLMTGGAVLGDAMLFVVLPLYWKEFGLNAVWQIGVLLSINRFIRLPINPLVGMFYKHFQLRTGVILALGIAIITTASYGLIQHFWWLVIMRALWGVGWSLLRLGGMLSIVSLTQDTNRGKFFGLYNGLWGLGSLFGMLCGGVFIEQASILMVALLFSIIGLALVPLAWIMIPLQLEQRVEHAPELASARVLSPYLLLVLLTGGSVGLVIFGLFSSTLSPLIGRIYTGEYEMWGLIIGAATLAGMIQAVRWGWEPFVAPFFGKIIDANRSPGYLLMFPLLLAGALFILLANAHTISLLLVLLLIFQVSSTLLVTATDTFAANAAARSDRVKAMTLYTIFVDTGAALGPLISYFIMNISSVSIVYYLAGGWLLLISSIWLLYFRAFNV